jgi:hypothetical protein
MKFCGLQKEKWKCLKLLVVDLVAEVGRGSKGVASAQLLLC